MNILLPGQYPRSERLVQATRDFDRKRITREELEKIRREDAEEFKKLQEGFPYISTGMFAWHDLLRPVAEIVPGCKVTSLKRFYETNTFWKVLEFTDNPAVDEAKLEEWVKKYFFADGLYEVEDPLMFTLPFIYLFKNYSSNIELNRIAGILDTVVKKMAEYPKKLLCFFEPSIGSQELSDEERKLGHEFFARVHSYSETPVILTTSFFNIKNEHDFLYSLPIEGIGVDFYANSVEEVMDGFPDEWLLAAGVLSTDSTHIEEPEKLAEFFKSIENHLNKSRIYGTTSGPAELLPRTVADAKVSNLREVLS